MYGFTPHQCLVVQMTSVERVMEYSDLKPEAAWESKAPPKNWPAHGTVMLDRVNFRYTPDGPLVLRNLSVAFQAKEKVDNRKHWMFCDLLRKYFYEVWKFLGFFLSCSLKGFCVLYFAVWLLI